MSKVILVFVLLIASTLSFSDVDSNNSTTKNSNELSEFQLMLSGFDSCDIRNVYFDEENDTASNKYFIKRQLIPIHIEKDFVSYKVNETFYGIPVKKIIIPNQYPVHALYFDVSVKEASIILSDKLKNGFHSLGDQHYFDKPVLMADSENKTKSVLTCGPKN